jgi:YVTN family beta-propeller protein
MSGFYPKSMRSIITSFLLIAVSLTFYTCRKDFPVLDDRGYPEEIGKILVTKCATTGCHNEQSKELNSGLSLETWSDLFKGNNSGSVVIPYRPDQSTLMFFINTYDEYGIHLVPTMPYNETPLSRDEVKTISDWIIQGAPDSKGFVKFSDNPNRKKIYVVNQGTELVSVIDAETGLVMRVISIGTFPTQKEAPHLIRVSPDNKHWYVVFNSGPVLQKYRTSDDALVGQVTLTVGPITSSAWNTFVISEDSKTAYVVDWRSNGSIKKVNLETMKVVNNHQIGGQNELRFPHGSAVNKAFTTLYVTAQLGNFIYRIDITDPDNPVIKTVPLQPGEMLSIQSKYDPHEVLLSPDESKYFVTCQKTNEVRVFSTATDSLLAVIPTGDFPQEMVISTSTGYLFVSCTEDDNPGVPFRPATGKGSIAVIDYATNSLLKHVYSGYRPHGMAVDEQEKKLYVGNRNTNQASHHSTGGDSNGYVSIIDMTTLQLVPSYRPEVSVDPYSLAIRP